MSAPRSIYIVVSYAPGFHKLLEYVRKFHPEARITLVHPMGYTPTESERKYIDDTVECPSRSLSPPSGWWGLWRLSRELRGRGIDHLGFQYESITLRLFAIACQPKEAVAWLGNGQLLQLPLNLGDTLADLLVHRVMGYRVMLTAAWHAFVLGAKNEPPERPKR
jgi:hypothetical protein